MRLIPNRRQEKVITSIVEDDSRGCIVAGQMGVGKTLIAIEAARRRGAKRILIAAPKSTFGFVRGKKYDGWIGTFARQYPDLPVRVIKKRADVTDEDGVFLIGREMLAAIRKDTTTEQGVRWGRVKRFDMFIYDEVHYIGKRKTKDRKDAPGFAAPRQVKTDYRLALSGTPFRTKFERMWAVCRFVWPAHTDIIPKSFWTWSYTWCKQEEIIVGKDEKTGKLKKAKVFLGEKKPGEFVKTLPNYHRLTAKSRVVEKKIFVDLSRDQRRAYSEMEETMVAWLKDKTSSEQPLAARLGIVKRIRLREMTLGVPTVITLPELGNDGYPKQTIEFDPDCKSAKIDAVKELLKDHDEPLLVFTHSQKFAEVAAHRLNAALWTGQSSDDERAKAKASFIDGHKQVLVATPRSFGTGTDGLQHVCDTMIFLSRDDSDTDNIQAIGRLDRTGQKSPNVTVIDIVAEDTFDEGDLSKEAQSVLAMMESLDS